MLSIIMKKKVFYFSFVTLLVALAVNPDNAKNLFVSDICKEALGLEKKADATKIKFVKSDNSWPHPFVKRKGTSNLKLEEVMNKDNDYRIYGHKFTYNEQTLIHCRTPSFWNPILLADSFDITTPLLLDEEKGIRIDIHYYSNCGSGCRGARVDTVNFVSNHNPFARESASDIENAYYSRWFEAYLTKEEKEQINNSDNHHSLE